ncbi:hypothetical protein [Ruegeria atlantica]|uniref:Uncharacterized protein n=1 Tax=Ruegeria atlantica TaxID=81569 RepID=A0A0P1ED34_9RHOB|nr:hypothetical protein [Ruegeria atlantica]CUH47434.1 hypothetical protein RUA4292_01604 [Ruegeria atlantica]
MTNRAKRRQTAAQDKPHLQQSAELHAWRRLEQIKQAGAQVPLSNNGAARALATISPPARRLLFGMVVVHADAGAGQCVFEQAVTAMGGKTLTWQVLDELHAAGLMRFNDLGNHEMHPLFGSIAHRLFEFGHDADGGGNGVEVGTNSSLHDKRGHVVLASSSIG